MLNYLILKMVMNTEESLKDLPTTNLPETPILKVRKSHLSREVICRAITELPT